MYNLFLMNENPKITSISQVINKKINANLKLSVHETDQKLTQR
jgi:hypothetical protein